RLTNRFGRRQSRDDHVGFQPTTEAAAKIVLVQNDVFGIDAYRRGRYRGRAGGELVAGVDVPDTILLQSQGIHWLHRSMDIDSRQVLRLYSLGCSAQGGSRIPIL